MTSNRIDVRGWAGLVIADERVEAEQNKVTAERRSV
jgi:hypothetical protein